MNASCSRLLNALSLHSVLVTAKPVWGLLTLVMCLWLVTGDALAGVPDASVAQDVHRTAGIDRVAGLNAQGLRLNEKSDAFFSAHPVLSDGVEWRQWRRTILFPGAGDYAVTAAAQPIGSWQRGRWVWPGRFGVLQSKASRQLREWIHLNGMDDDLRHELNAGDMQRLLTVAIAVSGQDGFHLLPWKDGWLVVLFSEPRKIAGSRMSVPSRAVLPSAATDKSEAGINVGRNTGAQQDDAGQRCLRSNALQAGSGCDVTGASPHVVNGAGAFAVADTERELARLRKDGNRRLAALDKQTARAKAALIKVRRIPVSDDNFMAVVNVSRLPDAVDAMQSLQQELESINSALALHEQARQSLRAEDQALNKVDADVSSSSVVVKKPVRGEDSRGAEYQRRYEISMQEADQVISEFNALQRRYYENLHGPVPLSMPMMPE